MIRNKFARVAFIQKEHASFITLPPVIVRLVISRKPARAILVLIILASSDGSGEPAQNHQSLRCLHTQSMGADEDTEQHLEL